MSILNDAAEMIKACNTGPDVYTVSNQWNGMLLEDEKEHLIKTVFRDKEDYRIMLYNGTGLLSKALAECKDKAIHIAFGAYYCPNEFSMNKSMLSASYTPKNVTIEYPIEESDDIGVDTILLHEGFVSSCFIDITGKKRSNSEEVVLARVSYPDTICILYPANNGSQGLLYYILNEAKKYIDLSEEEFKQHMDTISKRKLIDFISAPFIKKKAELLEQIRQKERNVAEHEDSITELNREIEVAKAEVLAISDYGDSEGQVIKIIEAIDAVNLISSVQSTSGLGLLADGIFEVTTKTIYVMCQGRRFLLGDYLITMNFFNKTVTFKNLNPELRRHSHWGDHCHHPHVGKDGSACLGNVREDISAALKEVNFQYATLLAISFLKNVNIDDIAGKNIVNWPYVDENGDIIEDHTTLRSCSCCGKSMPDTDEAVESWKECEACHDLFCPDCHSHYEIAGKDTVLCKMCTRTAIDTCACCGELHFKSSMANEQNIADDSSAIIETGKRLCSNCAREHEIVVPASHGILAKKFVYVSPETEAERIKTCSCGEKFFAKSEEQTQCPYCESGAEWIPCSDCGVVFPESSIISMYTVEGEKPVCKECSEKYVICSTCMRSVLPSECFAIDSEQGIYLCRSCQDFLTNTNEEEENNDV